MIDFIRANHLDRIKTEELDFLIIGGGINGVGIARDAAMRGLKVAVVEESDFCSGTSSKSSKMFHGGIRYLEQLHFALVFEASKERRLHSTHLCPHLATSVPFLIPVYPWSPHSRWKIALGVFLYDALALFRNNGTRNLNKAAVLAEEDRLEPNGLQGGVVYHDVVMDDVRVGIENVRSAAHHGAIALNYVTVIGFEKNLAGKVVGAWIKDKRDPAAKEFQVKAKAFLNATGPWCDRVRARADPKVTNRLRPTKGVHLILPEGVLGKTHGFVLTAKKDDRVFFSIPWFGRTLVGTTDTDYNPETDGPLDDIQATENDVDYLFEGVKRTFPGANVGRKDVVSTFAGLRPLVSEENASNPSAVSREHLIWRDPSGLFNIAGGKYTTYRVMSQQMVDYVLKECDWKNIPSKADTDTEILCLPSGRKELGNLVDQTAVYERELGTQEVQHLQLRYSARWQEVADLAVQDKSLRSRIISSEPDILAEMVYAKKTEMAVTFEDFLRRRTQLALRANLMREKDRVFLLAKNFGESHFDENRLLRIQGLQRK